MPQPKKGTAPAGPLPVNVASARSQAIQAITALFDALERSIAAQANPPLMEVPLPPRATRRLVASGELVARKIGRTWFAWPADIERLIPAARPKRDEPANDGAELAPEEGADRVLREILEAKGLRLRASGPANPKGASALRGGVVQASAGRRRA
jgi:hypothetical protein